jgi:hypothetical protein
MRASVKISPSCPSTNKGWKRAGAKKTNKGQLGRQEHDRRGHSSRISDEEDLKTRKYERGKERESDEEDA